MGTHKPMSYNEQLKALQKNAQMKLDKNCHKCGNEDSSAKWVQKVDYVENEVVNYEVLRMTCKECGWSWETETLDAKGKDNV